MAICLFKLANDDPTIAKRLPIPNSLKYQDKIELLAIVRNFFKPTPIFCKIMFDNPARLSYNGFINNAETTQMYIIETLQQNGTWWPFRYGKITGEPARFETISAAKSAYYIWNGGKRQAGKWRVVAAN